MTRPFVKTLATTSGPRERRRVQPSGDQKPKLMDRVHAAMRSRHYSRRAEEAYAMWIKRFIFFHNKRHPYETGLQRRHHLHESVVQRAVKNAAREAGIDKRVTCHLPPLVRHPSPRARPRHPHRPGAPRPSRRHHHDDLHPRPSLRRPRRAQPSGRDVAFSLHTPQGSVSAGRATRHAMRCQSPRYATFTVSHAALRHESVA
jgi:hypothetical protein